MNLDQDFKRRIMQYFINSSQCQGCQSCLTLCPAGAIHAGLGPDSPCFIDQDVCWRCGVCLRMQACPGKAFEVLPGEESSMVQSFFSDPNTTHRLTGVPGRGTEECKTNDVTERIARGEVGLCIEFGRPGTGCTFADIGRLTARLLELGVRIEANNPLCALMDQHTGQFPKALSEKRILSSILEVVIPEGALERVLGALREVAAGIDTVFSLGMVCRFDDNGSLPLFEQLQKLGVTPRPNAKINLGLGRQSNRG